MPIYLGIVGKAGAGKDTAGQMFAKEFNSFKVCNIPFAQSLKSVARELGWDGKKGQRGRRLLQLLGTDVCRDCIDTDYWVDKWEEIVDSRSPAIRDLIIATDVRFDNEAKAILQRGGFIVNVIGRSYYVRSWWKKLLDIFKYSLNPDGHRSEKGIDDNLIDYTICNDGNLEYLHKQVKYILKEITRQ